MNLISSRKIWGLAIAGLATLALATGESFATGKAAKSPTDWKILGKGDVMSGTTYTLNNQTERESLRYGKRTFGINMVWDKSTTLANMRFEKQGSKTALMYGDKIAIHVKDGGYLHYQHRTIGVNLVWSTPPKYEWMIMGGKKGTVVKTGGAVGLFNEVEKDFLIYAERPSGDGINLRWWKDRELAGGWTDRVRHAAEDLIRNEFEELAKSYQKAPEKTDKTPKK